MSLRKRGRVSAGKFEIYVWSYVMVFNPTKTDPTTRHALKTKFFLKSFEKYFSQIVCSGIPLL